MPIVPDFRDIVDIILVAFLLYYIYRLMKNSGALSIFMGVLSVVAVWILVTYVFQMKLIGAILNQVINVGAIAVIVLFQNEIRHFLVALGSKKQWKGFLKIFSPKKDEKSQAEPWVMPLVLACQEMSKSKTGALIAIENNVSLSEYIKTGQEINADVNTQLVRNLFFKNSPLHDGAMILVNGKIKAVACIMPLSQSSDLPFQFGLRHRAGLGVADASDAYVIVVSEETGKILFAHNGEYKKINEIRDLEIALSRRR